MREDGGGGGGVCVHITHYITRQEGNFCIKI